MTEAVKAGDTISVHYTGRLTTGEAFDASKQGAPLAFTVGSGALIKGFDKAVVGMVKGEKKTVTIEPEEGYGLRNEELYVEIPVTAIPDGMQLVPGAQVELASPDGSPMPAVVADVGEEMVRMDLNHFLAGKALEFEIEIHDTGLEPQGGSHHGCGCHDDNCGHSH